MKRNSQALSWLRLLVIPTAVSLISMSVIVGYASNGLFPGHSAHMRAFGSPLHLSWLENPALSRTQDHATSDGEPSTDPVADYKAALDLLQKDYYGSPLDSKQTRQLTYEGIRGMLASLRDQFTSFLDPDEWSQFHATTRGDFEGIGAFLQPEGLYVKVARPIETGPAEKAGLKADDLIVRVNHESMKGKDINYVVHKIKGPRGTKVLLEVMRDKKQFSFQILRALVEPPVVEHWMEDPQTRIGHIVLKEFNEKSMEQLERAYSDLNHQDMKGLILDLRNNPGGLLEVAIQVVSAFIPRDTNKALNNAAVIIRDGNGREQPRALSASDTAHRPIPMVVLVNDGSASASEIVTGAIKDYGIATIMGERTFGKGKVQTLFPLDDGSALRLTTQLYFPPKHNDINFKRDEDGDKIAGTGGIVPDIEVAQSPKWRVDDFKDKANDLQLHKAIVFLRAKLQGLDTAQAAQIVRQTP